MPVPPWLIRAISIALYCDGRRITDRLTKEGTAASRQPEKGAAFFLFRANKVRQRGPTQWIFRGHGSIRVVARGLLWPNCGCEVGLQLRTELWRSCVAEQHGSSVAKSAEGLGKTPRRADRRDGLHRPISA